MKYRNISKHDQTFRAGEGGKKKVYTVKAGKEIELPVIISHGAFELVGDMRSKTKQGEDK